MPIENKQLTELQEIITSCTRCPRLVNWREKVANEKTKRFASDSYWGGPVPGFGPHNAELLIVGLAPAAHGANRTGRMFTGDRSGDWLYRALHRFGFANQPESYSRDDGLKLKNCYITASVRCAPPQNKPTVEEKSNCFEYLAGEFDLLTEVKVIIALGKIAFDSVAKLLLNSGITSERLSSKFAHGVMLTVHETLSLLGSYHPSQQNTFTGKLTESMFDSVFASASNLLSRKTGL